MNGQTDSAPTFALQFSWLWLVPASLHSPTAIKPPTFRITMAQPAKPTPRDLPVLAGHQSAPAPPGCPGEEVHPLQPLYVMHLLSRQSSSHELVFPAKKCPTGLSRLIRDAVDSGCHSEPYVRSGLSQNPTDTQFSARYSNCCPHHYASRRRRTRRRNRPTPLRTLVL